MLSIRSSIVFLFLFVVLVLGRVTFDERLALINSISINQIIFPFFLAILVFLYKKELSSSVLISFIFLLPVFISTISVSFNASEFGLEKLINLNFVSFICILFGSIVLVSDDVDIKLIFKFYVLFCLIISIFALLYKVRVGVFNRDTGFLLFGPITYGRLMGGACIISFFYFSGLKKWFLSFFFLFNVLITFSKGPILSIFLSMMIFVFFINKDNRTKLIICFLLLLLWFHLHSIVEWLFTFDMPSLNRILNLILIGLSDGDLTSGSNYGSVGSRVDMYMATLAMMMEYPMGVGLGNWSEYIKVEGLYYPHNFFLEVFSEFGFLFGGIFIIPYIMPFAKFISSESTASNSALITICFFYMVNQMFSGSISDSRYWLFFSFLFIANNFNYKSLNNINLGNKC